MHASEAVGAWGPGFIFRAGDPAHLFRVLRDTPEVYEDIDLGTDTEATRAEAQAQGARFWSEALTARMIAAKDRAAALRLDCRECGACCCSVIPGKHIVVNMDFDEASRIEAVRPGATAHWRGQARAIVDDPKPWGSACQFLRGRPGACSCSIYYDRPQPCLVFPAGIEECLTMRKAVLPVVGVPLAKGERNGGVR